MAAPIETNEEYYAGEKVFGVVNPATQDKFVSTFNIELTTEGVGNFVVQLSTDNGVTWSDITAQVDGVANDNTVSPPYFTNTVSLNPAIAPGVGETYLVKVKLKEEAFRNNYGSYSYITLDDIINNFLAAYVGAGKLIPSVKRTDVIFHAKRGLQEFSYDTLKSIKSQELTVPDNLSLVIPQDYVNYVKLSYVDGNGVKHTIYPTQLTSSPYYTPVQDKTGKPIQDNFSDNVEGTSLTNERWQAANPNNITGFFPADTDNPLLYMYDWWGEPGGAYGFYGQRYGGDPVNMQVNGWFNIDERRGTFNFSSDLSGKLIILEYISDGLAYDLDSKIPKLAEEAMYQHLLYSIMSTRRDTAAIAPQYKRQRYAALRNAKIRLSNIKLDEIVQVMRNKSKWIKH